MNPIFPVGTLPRKMSAGVRYSPYFVPQKGIIRNSFYLPKLRDLPRSGLGGVIKTFDFGFNPGSSPLDPYETNYQSIGVNRPLLVYAMTGASSVSGDDSPVSPAFLFNLTTTDEKGVQSQIFNKTVTDLEMAPGAQHPMPLPRLKLILPGQQVQCEVQNLGNVTLYAQIALWGGEFV